jgi:uncharacterized membrane protein YraQ (UPF0718 family)
MIIFGVIYAVVVGVVYYLIFSKLHKTHIAQLEVENQRILDDLTEKIKHQHKRQATFLVDIRQDFNVKLDKLDQKITKELKQASTEIKNRKII